MSFARIVEVTNPFDIRKSMVVHNVKPGLTLRQWLRKRFGKGFKDFKLPTVCNINGKWISRELWGKIKTKAGDLVQFITSPGYEAVYFAIALAVVALVVAIALMPAIPGQGDGGKTPPAYTLQGQNNRYRPGEPIEICYGRNRIYPSYAAVPYNRYINHEQYQYSVFCLGVGYFDIEEVRIEDTPIANFPDVDFEILEPGDAISLLSDNVVTVAEVGGIELFGPNQAEFPASGWAGPFTLNPAGTTTTKIEIDLICPNGLFANVSGLFSNTDVFMDFEIREIDDTGEPLGDWEELVSDLEIEDSKTRPRAYTFDYTVTAGRYEIRGKRTNDAPTTSQIVNRTLWQSAKAYLPDVGTYEGVTCIAVVAKATNSLNDNSKNRFNAIATRKLPVYDSEAGTWSDAPGDLVATRSPVIAFADAFRAEYGGNLPDSYLDMDELLAMDEIFTAGGIQFDWIFDQKATLFDIAKTICRVGRSIPMMAGSRLFMIRDQASEDVVSMFSPDNILQGSFSQEFKLFEFDGFDSTIVEYVDPVTFQNKEVTTTLPGGTTDNPERFKLQGCTSETVAWREGMYMNSVRRYLRKRIIFRTGLEAIIPVYGDLISVSHDVPRWGTAGTVEEYAIEGAATLLTLSEDVEFPEAVACKLVLRNRYGEPSEPLACVAGPDANQVLLAVAIDPLDYPLGASREPLLFTFGPVDTLRQVCKVISIKPGDGEEVEIECLPYVPGVYEYDSETPP
jgi:hypothetical protein